MKVLKFGGSSVGKPERIKQIAGILQELFLQKGEQIAVVVSAFGGGTDKLLEMARLAESEDTLYKEIFDGFKERHIAAVEELIPGDKKEVFLYLEKGLNDLSQLLHGIHLLQEASKRSLDLVQSYGERCSAYIIAHYLKSLGIDSEYIDARKWIKTNNRFGSAMVDFTLTNNNIANYFKENPGKTPLITGFIGSTTDGLTTTLGRGGSDFTASIIAAGANAEALEIWTDVNGVLTCDPRKVPKAYTVDEMSYEEAMEMSHFGAKVIYPPTIQPVMAKKIPIYIRNTFEPSFIGTKIHSYPKLGKNQNPIKGLSSLDKLAMISLQGSGLQGVPGIAARLFQGLSKEDINVIMITQASSENSISFAIKSDNIDQAVVALNAEFEREMERNIIEPIGIDRDISLVAIIGDNMSEQPGVAGKLFKALGKNGVNVEAIAQGSSERNITFATKTKDEIKALNAIHDAFFLSKNKSIHLFMTGIGLIGGTLIDQIHDHGDFHRTSQNLDIKIVGLTNTTKMLHESEGMNLENWKDQLLSSDTSANLEGFIDKMIELNLPNSIFIDNTASDVVPKYYEKILSNNISISTPNKVAASSEYGVFNNLKELAKHKNVRYCFETNVGAGLPVISTLNNLITSGDEILKIEAVLSGSVSYIFNNYSSKQAFSDIVTKAKEMGLTEPDPRDDLSGKDVARKITILAREAGYQIETSDVNIEDILPEECLKAANVDDFFKKLVSNEAHFSKLINEAEASSKKLRFIANYENSKAGVSLKMVDESSPFYSLSGSDNMVVFTTKRYTDTPLVVRGPGAGAAVTAAGIFAEIIAIANR